MNKAVVNAVVDGLYLVGIFWPPGQYDPNWVHDFEWVTSYNTANSTLFITPNIDIQKQVWNPALQTWTETTEAEIGDIVEFECHIKAPSDTVFTAGLELIDYLPVSYTHLRAHET